MNKILYLHGFASSSKSNKANLFRKIIDKQKLNYQCIIPDLPNNISEAFKLIENLVIDNKPKFIIGSSLGGFYSTYFAEQFNLKSILLNPAVLPANGMKIYLGENENYSTGERFEFTNLDIQVLKKFESEIKRILLPENHYVFLESGDEILNYLNAVNYYCGSSINIFFGGNHSLEMFEDNMHQVINILQS